MAEGAEIFEAGAGERPTDRPTDRQQHVSLRLYFSCARMLFFAKLVCVPHPIAAAAVCLLEKGDQLFQRGVEVENALQ